MSYDLRRRVAGSGESAWSHVVSVWTSGVGGDLELHDRLGLDNGVSYEVGVRAVNALGDGVWSDPAQAAPRTRPDKSQPPTLAVGDTELVVSWVAPGDGGWRDHVL